MPAQAVPRSKLEQARKVKKQIDALDRRLEIASDRYYTASARHRKLIAEKNSAGAKLKKTRARMSVVQRHLNRRAASMYRKGAVGFVDVLLGAESFEELASTWDLLREFNRSDAENIAKLKTLRRQYDQTHRLFSAKEKAAAAQERSMKANKRAAERDLAERKAKLRGIEAEIAALEAADLARQSARAAALVRSSLDYERQFPPPTRASRGEVVDIARRYIGAPYSWGADGPNSFDCSGFTMFVYRQVGVYLPHSSRAQIGCGERVSRSELAPGDLVFFGSPIHHVGIYVGGGMMIHAPHSGAYVRIDPLHSNYAGACRP